MRNSRTVQTIIQAALLVLLAAIVFRKPPKPSDAPGAATGQAIPPPSPAQITTAYKTVYQEHPDASRKTELTTVKVRAVSVDGPEALVRLRIEFRWIADNPDYTDGPLKNAPGQLGDRVAYTETFAFRRWDTGWEIEGRREPADIR